MDNSQHLSEKVQLEILNEISELKPDTTINKSDTIRAMNYEYLIQQGCIEQIFTAEPMFKNGNAVRTICGERLTDKGKEMQRRLHANLATVKKSE